MLARGYKQVCTKVRVVYELYTTDYTLHFMFILQWNSVTMIKIMIKIYWCTAGVQILKVYWLDVKYKVTNGVDVPASSSTLRFSVERDIK